MATTESSCQHCCRATATRQDMGINLCEQCQERLSAPDLPDLSDVDSSQGWHSCRWCGKAKYNSEVACEDCGYVEMTLVPDPVIEETKIQPNLLPNLKNPYWTCVCGYEYNNTPKCPKCGRTMPGTDQREVDRPGQFPPQSLSNFTSPIQQPQCTQPQYQYNTQDSYRLQSLPVEPPPTQDCTGQDDSGQVFSGQGCSGQSYSGQVYSGQGYPGQSYSGHLESCETTWKCQNCKYAYNPEKSSTCERCTIDRTAIGIPWMCFECGEKNPSDFDRCFECNTSRDWIEYLISKKVKLSDDKQSWKCENCGIFPSIRCNVCYGCYRENEVITKGSKGKGNRITLKRKIFGLLKDVL